MRPNILLIVLDATRADHCSCYGGARSLTPVLDQLAAEGTLFEQAFACAPWTLPAMSSILTGQYPSQTGIEERRQLASTYTTLPALLRQGGYATFAISNNSWFSTDFGLNQGFMTVHKLWQRFQTETDLTEVNLTQQYPAASTRAVTAKRSAQGNWLKNALNLMSGKIRTNSDYGARRTLAPVQRWISAQDGPWFALIHYLEAHLEYKPPAAWARRFVDDWPTAQKLLAADQVRLCYRHITGAEVMSADELRTWGQLYAAEVAYQDHMMGKLIDWLKRAGKFDDTLIIVVADHGESLGEHGLLNHLYGLYDPLTRVPLVLRGPGSGRGRRRGDLVQTNDIFGTALAAAGLPLPENARNLLDESGGRRYVVAEYGTPRTPHQELLNRFSLQAHDFAPFLRSLTAVRTAQHKLVVGSDGSQALFDLVHDPAELANLAATEPDVLASMQAALAEWQTAVGIAPSTPAATTAPPAVAPEVAARLKALGYLD